MQRKKDYIYNPREFRRNWQRRFSCAPVSPRANDDWATQEQKAPSRWLVFMLGVVVGFLAARFI